MWIRWIRIRIRIRICNTALYVQKTVHRVLNGLWRARLSFGRMRQLADGTEGEGGGRGAESYDH
jgi:hypothetical protein